jgi:hypothetical protein
MPPVRVLVTLAISLYNGTVWDPISIGNMTEGKVLAALVDAGYQILLPFGGGCFVPYTTDADYFGVYCPQTHEVYLVPVSDVPEGSANLRIDAPMNNQAKGIRWAKSYVISTSVRKGQPGLRIARDGC